VINGKVCNGHHLRRDCVKFKELQRVARETAAVATEEDEEDTVGCIFDVTCGECSPIDYQDGTSAYSFDMPVAPAVDAAEVGEFGFNKFVEVPIAGADEEQAPVFEALTPTPPMVGAPPPPVYVSVEAMLNLAALLFVISLECSMLVPSEPGWSDDDDVFFVGSATATPSFGFVYGLMALVVALATALVFVMFQRKPPLDDDAMRCWICDRTGHVKSNCPERVVTSNGPPKVKKQRVRGPKVYVEGVHTRCERMVDGVRCNKHHLRRDCEEQPNTCADDRLSLPLTIGTVVLTPAQTAKLTTEQRRAVVSAIEISFPPRLRSQPEGEMMDKLNVWAESPEVLDVALDTGATPSMVLSIPSRQPAQTREIVAIQSVEQPPMAGVVDVNEKIVWIESPYSAANVQFLKSHYARWCSDRNCWYMLAASSAAANRNLDAVLERFGRCSEPSRTDVGKFKKSTCTKPCYACPDTEAFTWPSGAGSTTRRRRPQSATAPLFLLTLFTCMVPSDAATESMFAHHMRTAQWQLLAIYVIILVATAGNLLKRFYNSGALAGLCEGVKSSGMSIADKLGTVLCSMLRRVDASALTVDVFMDNVRKRHSPSLTAYYTAIPRCSA
jgi:hypothetical protein